MAELGQEHQRLGIQANYGRKEREGEIQDEHSSSSSTGWGGDTGQRMTMTVGLRFLRQVGHIGFTKTSKRDH